ncbi:hypothetical protein LOTGIDRAFT_140318 [Lottia gigantea]|uniref:Thymidylate kinase n=1 Tax=Lottia gigantea TaxID=225164 RepID=V4B0U3_LOTGI|nr:hypothetical protein LOTGIDRAFT_140318 [Lottia gigantea]ESP00866.1 hypothetical protein LOTGIDRAFT_140318 [Lottia gigantea]
MAVSNQIERGALIVFEGCDRSGKSTQCGKLVERLKNTGIKAKLLKFPDRRTTIGKMINSYLGQTYDLEDHAIHLLFSANRWEARDTMMTLLNQGTTLIVDRYAYSGAAFTAAKQGFSLEWCKQTDIGLPQPDTVLYLTLTSEAAAKRGGFGEERYEKEVFQEKVAKNFQDLKDKHWQVIDADRSIEDLHEEIYHLTQKVINQAKYKPIEKLWTEL